MVSKIDYYELLDVEQDATNDQLKAAFRRKALQHHPDKNPDNPDEAHEMFKAVHEAYSVLSDSRERAWYDSHKSEILTGSKSGDIDLWSYFSASAYPGDFTDEPNGFYTVFRELFDKIHKQENSEAASKSKVKERPSFGDSSSDAEFVKRFYNYWVHFATTR